MLALRGILGSLVFVILLGGGAFATSTDYIAEGREGPVYEICGPYGDCVQARLQYLYGDLNMEYHIYSNGISWTATTDPDEYQVRVNVFLMDDGEYSSGVQVCKGKDCNGWSFNAVGNRY